MKNWIVLMLMCCLSSPLWAKPKVLSLIDWKHGPEQVHRDLSRKKSNKAELKMFHKTGVRYIRASLSTLGNVWKSTVYFSEEDRPNQLLFQLDKVTPSALHRIEHLALEEFGEDYESKKRPGKIRDDHAWIWNRDGFEIKLDRARYHSSKSLTVWLNIKRH